MVGSKGLDTAKMGSVGSSSGDGGRERYCGMIVEAVADEAEETSAWPNSRADDFEGYDR